CRRGAGRFGPRGGLTDRPGPLGTGGLVVLDAVECRPPPGRPDSAWRGMGALPLAPCPKVFASRGKCQDVNTVSLCACVLTATRSCDRRHVGAGRKGWPGRDTASATARTGGIAR